MEKCCLFKAVSLIFSIYYLVESTSGIAIQIEKCLWISPERKWRLETVGRYLGSQEVVSFRKGKGGPSMSHVIEKAIASLGKWLRRFLRERVFIAYGY